MSAQTADMIAGRSAQASPNPTSQPASPAARQPPAKKSRKKGPSKPADSAADFRRKEANRLAAERSRMRAAEKAQAIKKAVEEAQEEQAQLEERIRELEEEKRRREAGAEVRREVEAAIAASEAEIAHGAEQGGETAQRVMGGDGHGDGGEVDADAHSRSILAALMSGNIPGLQEYADQVDDLGTQGGAQHVANGEAEVQGQAGQPSTSNWPDTPVETPSIGGQVESNTAGYPSSERASAINTVSNTAQTDTSVDYGSHPPSPLLQQHHAPSNQDSTNTTPAVQPRPAPTSTRTTLPPLHSDNILSTAHTSYIYSPQSALTAVCSSVAVLLNAEMEKTLRDDVAASREAIAGLEKEIERLEMAVREAEERGRAAAGGDGGEAVGGDGEAPQPERHSELAPPPNPLPAQTFHPVPILRSVIQYLLDLTTTTQSRLPRAQEDVALFRTLKVSEEARLSGVVRRYLAMDTAPPGASGTGGANASADQSRGPATEDPVDTDREQSGSTPNQDAGGTVEDEERYLEDKKHHVAGVRANLRGLGGYLGYLIWGSQEFAASASTDHTTYSTPAIAKRKRGRPSKASQQAKQSHSMLYPSAPSTSSRLAPPARTASPHAASASTSASPATPAGAGAGATSTTATASTGSGSGRGRGTATARPAARLKKNMVQYARVPAGAAAAAAAARSAPPSSRAGRVDDGAVSPVMAHSAPQGHSVSGHATGAGAGADGGVQESMDDQEQASEIVKHLRATLAGGHAPSTATGDVGEEAESPNAGGRSSEGGAADGATPPARAVADLGRSSSSDIRQGQAEAANTDNPNTDPVLAQLERSGEAFASLLRAQMADEDDPAASPSSHSQQEQAGPVESRVEVDGHGYEQEQYEHENEGEGQGDEEEEYDADGTLRPAQGGSGSGSGHIAVNGVDPLDPTVLEQLGKGPPGSCEVCSRTQSTVWRKLTVGEEDYRVCNACGLYHKKFGVVRPAALWGDGESVRKRRPARGPDEDRRRVKRSKQYMGDEGVGTGFRSNGMGLPNHYTAGPGNNMSISSLSHHVEREYAVQAGHLQGHGNRGGAAGEGAWGEDEEAGEAGAGEGGDAQKARPRGKTSRYAPTESLLKASGVTAAQEQARLLQAVRTAASAAGGLPMEEFDPSALFDKGDDPAPVSVSASGDVADGEGADAAEGGAGNKEKVIRGHYHRAPVLRPGAAPGGDEEEEEEVEEVEEQRVQYDLQHHRFDPQHHYIREAQRAVEAAQRQQYLEEQEQIRSAAQAGAQIVYGEEQEQYYDPATHGQYDPAQQYDTTVQMDPHGHLQSHGQEDSGMQVGQYGYVHPDPDLGQSGYSHDPHSLPHEFQHQHQQQHHDHQQTHQPQLQHQHDQQPVRYTDPGMDLAQQALDAGIHLPDGVDLGDVAGVPDLMEVFGHLQ